MTDEKKVEEKVTRIPRKLTKPRFKQADLVRAQYSIVAEAGSTPDDLLDKGYWQHVASDLRPGDRIEVLTDDMRWAGDLIVHSCGRLWASVKFMSIVQFSEITDAAAPDKLRVQYRGPHHRFSVVDDENKASPEVIRTGFENQEDAMVFLLEYRKTKLRVA